MKISIITIFPELYDSFLNTSLIKRARDEGLVQFSFMPLCHMCVSNERIDEPTCGPGAGMVLKPVVIDRAIACVEEKWGRGYRIFFSPQGELLNQRFVKDLIKEFVEKSDYSALIPNLIKEEKYKQQHLILVCPRYEGVDERVENYYADKVISIGDYVVMGGDLPAQVFLEALLRQLPGVVGAWDSVIQESFSQAFLDYPTYGLPVEWRGKKVPEILLSGNHAAIEAWRKDQAARKTVLSRFDWFSSARPTKEEIAIAKKHIPSHYVAVMHTDVIIKGGRIGETSITSLDVHDIARSAATYDIKNVFFVTPLVDQQKILKTFLEFWHSSEGIKYNKSRHFAVQRVVCAKSLDAVKQDIKNKEGVEPLVITTSARFKEHQQPIDYFSQGMIWEYEQPVLFLYGTGQGLSDELIAQSDFLLEPVYAMSDYNHLSVRAAVSITLDRWLGLHPKRKKL
jgi:tRNA (guanine37-N1)-methyltransferase